MKKVLYNSPLPEFEKSPGVFDGQPPGELRFHRIGLLQVVIGFRQHCNAPGTKDLLPFNQRTKTRLAIERKE
jgi:hypothetical protein